MSSSTASVLAEPFDVYLRRRARSSVPLTPGEAVTAAVGLLRGCREAAAAREGTRWWLTATGCPVAVEDPGGLDAVAATAEGLAHLAEIAADPPTRDLIDRARASVLTRPPRDWDALERRFFSHAAPLPLVLGPLIPSVEAAPPVLEREGAVGRVLELVDADLAEAARSALGGVRERWRSSRALRLAIVAGGFAAIAVIGFSLLPTEQTPDPVASAHTMVDPAPSTTTPWLSEPPPVDERRPLSDDVQEIARSLFGEIAACRGERACVSTFEENSAFPRETLLADAAAGRIEVVDDFGGVTVVRVDTAGSTQYVTLVRQNERWLVRAARTVTDQPS
ncbi:hypothetical protein J2X55_002872 [Microbacterium sp. 1154]|uniref:hypothetical protein n=1 Tax=Microbacterium sp. 1154 TaxID=2817733 RepID=UPI00285857E2|nr:hypothetical protein [Microbacterium sp. 1154]MDR6691942.1 hypothetical protein [Microbacterium sp. 1154]